VLRNLIFVLSIALATEVAQGQTTWHNMQFGESSDAIRATLQQQSISVTASRDGTLSSSSDYFLAIPGVVQPFPMQLKVHFDSNQRMNAVTLSLDIANMRGDWGVRGSSEVLATFAAEKLTGALSGRYGAPLYRSSPCDAEVTTATFCTITWRGQDQTIELEHSMSANGPRVVVRYQPLANDL
jgi:hypothetical protein